MGISVSSATARQSELQSLFLRLSTSGMTPTDISNDELAKTHLRYLVGGRSSVPDERLFMFEFPERPGALFKFLSMLRPGQNITLFQYRNVGGDVGRILAGIQCEEGKREWLDTFLREIGHPFTEVTESWVGKTFLRE